MAISMLLFTLGAPEIIIVLIAIVLIFGGKKIPELMRGLGQGMNEFKKARQKGAVQDENEEDKKPLEKSK